MYFKSLKRWWFISRSDVTIFQNEVKLQHNWVKLNHVKSWEVIDWFYSLGQPTDRQTHKQTDGAFPGVKPLCDSTALINILWYLFRIWHLCNTFHAWVRFVKFALGRLHFLISSAGGRGLRIRTELCQLHTRRSTDSRREGCSSHQPGEEP